MRLILSRKGFDSSAGGCPSPILPDGRLLSLPIPDKRSKITYRDIQHSYVNMGRLVSQLTRGRVKGADGAHLDPDLITGHLDRLPGWIPVLGQTGSAQGHLRKQGVEAGDLFLFFGLFREAEIYRRRWRFIPGSRAKHILWGWMQIGEVINIDSSDMKNRPWLDYHPHRHGEADSSNTLYLSNKRLTIQGCEHLAGSGVFTHNCSELQLTAMESDKPSVWDLPPWFYPDQRSPLSYHSKPERWSRDPERCQLQCAARGQEFVLQAEQYPELIPWLKNLLNQI